MANALLVAIFSFLWLLLAIVLALLGFYLFWLLATSTKRGADALERIARALEKEPAEQALQPPAADNLLPEVEEPNLIPPTSNESEETEE
ncbi:MAG: hypothetical protein GX062_08100 [Firmicutes bacterium]|jgi:Flp pilus assembly protein TadB|nr:hypothetical protein [Bacillota bacterium]